METQYQLKLYIKYMVSNRCKMLVRSELDKLGLVYGAVDLGEVEVRSEIDNDQLRVLRVALAKAGLEVMDNKKAVVLKVS